jgi:hypothetical protein
MILKRLFYVLIFLFLVGCSLNNSIADNKRVYKINEIPDNAIERIDNAHVYVIKFSNLIYDTYRTAKKQIKIPIFQGYLDDVKYDDFLTYCEEKKLLKSGYAESGFVILTKKGELKKTLLEFIKYHEGNILKGYEKSVVMHTSGDEPKYLEWVIIYEFKVENIPCYMVIYVSADEKDFSAPSKSFKSIEDIHPDEKMETPSFLYQFNIDSVLQK